MCIRDRRWMDNARTRHGGHISGVRCGGGNHLARIDINEQKMPVQSRHMNKGVHKPRKRRTTSERLATHSERGCVEDQ
eukprot:9870475-Heterocapsa_arctica.AAC.1